MRVTMRADGDIAMTVCLNMDIMTGTLAFIVMDSACAIATT
jgi:hypothetical protein